jgi:SAM-dependent methyltransferase
MIAALKRRYIREQYLPGWLGMLTNPYYHARRGLHQAILPLAPEMSGRVLDIGCGQKPYQALFPATAYVGLEYDSPANRASKKADFFYDGAHFPFADGEFDSALCSQVLEHVFTPEAFLAEINRVIKPGGKLLLTLPFVWDEHEQPYDFARYSSFGLKALLERHDFDVLQQRKTLPDLRVIFQLVNAYLYKLLIGRNPYINMIICALFMAPFTLLGSLLACITPRNPDLYLDNVVLARKRSAA